MPRLLLALLLAVPLTGCALGEQEEPPPVSQEGVSTAASGVPCVPASPLAVAPDPPAPVALPSGTVLTDVTEQAVGMAPDEATRRLRAVPGIGEWTAAEIAQRALGDTDAVSVGDYHLSQFVGWALLGRPVDDDGMVELLEPWRPHRYRVIRLLECSGVGKPRFGPRATVQDHRAH